MIEKEMKILLSYHRHDIEWRDFLVDRLKPFVEKGQLDITDDQVTESSQRFAVYEEGLSSFDVIILCISKKYLSLNNFVGKEIPEKILPVQKRGTRVILVYLENCSWQAIGWLREMKLWPSHQLPFSNMSIDERVKFISRFIKDMLKLGEVKHAEYGYGKYGEGVYGGKNDVQAIIKEAHKAFENSEFDRAIELCDKVLSINPNADSSWVMKAKALSKKGEHEDATNCFNEGLKYASNKSYLLLEKGIVYREMGKKDEEFYCYDQAIEKNPKYIQAYMQKAHALQQDKQYEEAIKCLRKGIYNDLEPEKEAALWHSLAVTYLGIQNYEEAYRSINRSLELYDNEHTRRVRDAIERDMSSREQIDVPNVPDEDETKREELVNAFNYFLQYKKGFPENVISQDRIIDVDMPRPDIALIDPESSKVLALVEFSTRSQSLDSLKKIAQEYFSAIPSPNNTKFYIVELEEINSSEQFKIFECFGYGEVKQVSMADFPSYEDLKSKVDAETEASGGEGGDDDFGNVFRENLIAFLINEKKFPRESLNHGIVAEAPDMDLVVAHPDTDNFLAVFDYKSGHYGKPSPEVSESMAKTYKSGLVGIQNPFAYIVQPSEESNEEFVIFEVEDDGTSNEISYEDFPIYDQLLFASPLSAPGRRIYRNLIRLAKDKHGFGVHTPCQDYIDLQIKKNKRTAAQIHRLDDSDDNISLVLAGYQKDFPQPKLPTYMFEGEVEQLSGYTSKSQGERNWLKGNLGHQELKYEAGVYILRPGALVLDEIENEVGDLLELAKNNAEGEKEPEAKKVSKYGRGGIATIQMDRLSDVDLLGRERLVRAFAGMFVHTEEVEGFTVALLGDWGEGKSTVMKLLRKSLNEKHPGRFDFATFNAWEYEHTDNMAAGLSQEVVKGLKSNLGLGRFHTISLAICFNIIENRWNLFKLVLCGIISCILYIHLDPLSFSFKGEMLLKESVGTGLLGLGGLSTLIYLIKIAKNIIGHPLPTNLEKYFKLPDYAKHLGLIPVLKRHITTLCKLKLNTIRIPFTKIKIGKDRKLVVFVDDLDRCQTDCIARSLDAIRLVMSISNVIVMIGIDYRIAFKAMENYYEKLGDKGRDKSEIARDYLGKIIQLPVRLMHSSPEEVQKYVEKRLFPDAQIMEDIEKDGDIDTERGVIERSKPKKEIIEAEREDIGDRIPDDKKVEEPKSVEEILKDTTIERDMFSNLAKRFNFTNPRQLLRLRNSYRFLKVMDSEEKYDREILMKILFRQEFLNNLPSIIRDQCEKSVTKEESLGKIEKHEAKQIVQGVQEDILKTIEMPMYEEIERFVRIVVLPRSEEGVLDTREEIE